MEGTDFTGQRLVGRGGEIWGILRQNYKTHNNSLFAALNVAFLFENRETSNKYSLFQHVKYFV